MAVPSRELTGVSVRWCNDGTRATMLEASVKRGDHALDSAAFVLLRADQLAAPPHVVVPAAGFESGHGTLAFRDAVVDLRAVLDEQCEEMLGLTAIRCRCVRGPIATPVSRCTGTT
jgi:hypothetical protein